MLRLFTVHVNGVPIKEYFNNKVKAKTRRDELQEETPGKRCEIGLGPDHRNYRK